MSYIISCLKNSQIITVTYSGDISLDIRLTAVHDLCSHYNNSNAFKLLIDSREASQQMTKNEQIIFGRYLADREEFKGALVATLAKANNGIDKVIVKEAANLGYQISAFTTKKEALNWLEGVV